MSALTLITLAWVFELLLGYPAWLFDRIGHPVSWLGRLIGQLEKRWNLSTQGSATRRRRGTATVLVVVGCAVAVALLITAVLPDTVIGLCIEALLASTLLASRSLYTHVLAVYRPLQGGNLLGARSALALIVGRDTRALDEAAIARAALESLAENASDGVIAPLFLGVLFGLPGLAAYKAINTLDSMIGHKDDRYIDFGRTAARLDDLANWLPARLSGWLFCLASVRREPFRIMQRDAHRHRSPSAGWPESALAGALRVRLSGPRRYGDRVSNEPWLNAGAVDPLAADLHRGLQHYCRAMAIAGSLLIIYLLALITI